MGGWTPEMTLVADAELEEQLFLKSQQQAILDYFNQENVSINVTMFEPESYTTQVVAGTNYSVVYKINSSEKIEVKFWLKLDGTVQIM